jgi:RnfABCDGE-type electron transport complex B subunit
MNITGIFFACLIVGGIGVIIGLLLGIAGKKFAVEVDEKEAAIRECLPGSNCGGCGFAGCDSAAEAIAKGTAQANACPVGGAKTASKIAEILGVEVETVKKTAYVKCAGDCEKAGDKYEYTGNMSCKEAVYVTGKGPKKCTYGCMGLASCVKVCEFGALKIENGIAVVDREKCVACGKCVKECPKGLITILPYDNQYHVKCNSHDKGAEVNKVCSAGCIGCSLCVKACPKEAVKVTDFLAEIDYEKCVNCGLCAQKCPKKIIQ